jgi:RNA polymerase sigma-70 factor (ECF subfamily)
VSTHATDEELVESFQGGDVAAFDLLVRRWDRRMLGAIYRIVGPAEDARDLAQEVFFKAFRALGSFKREARFSSWLYQIALNVCRDRLRRRRRSAHVVSLDALLEAGENLPRDRPALDWAEASDLGRVVERAVASLAEEHREVVVLKEYEGLTFAEISAALGVPVSTVKTRLYRALSLLREHLEPPLKRNLPSAGSHPSAPRAPLE